MKTSGVPTPIRFAPVGWARDPEQGPIFGERIERYANGDAQRVFSATQQPGSCEWTEGGGHWRATVEQPVAVGDDSRIFLVTSLDRPDSFNYESAVRFGDLVVRTVLNVRTADRLLADDLNRRAWDKAMNSQARGR